LALLAHLFSGELCRHNAEKALCEASEDSTVWQQDQTGICSVFRRDFCRRKVARWFGQRASFPTHNDPVARLNENEYGTLMEPTMRSAMLVLAVTLACTSAPAMAEPAKPPYNAVGQLSALCIPTKADAKAVRQAALAAGYRLNAQDKDQVNLGDDANSVALRTGVGHIPYEPEIGGPVEVDVCQMFVYPAVGQDTELLAWLGLKGARPSLPWSFFIDEVASGPHVIGGRDAQAKRRALDGGRLRMIKIEPLGPEGVMVMYGVMRRPVTTGSATPSSAERP
jgi:hypothetical protein